MEAIYRLPKHVFARKLGDDVVVLDLAKDSYVTLTEESAVAFLNAVEHTSAFVSASKTSPESRRVQDQCLTDELRSAGIITDDSGGKLASPCREVYPRSSLMERVLHSDRPITPLMLLHLINAVISARWCVQRDSLAAIIERSRLRHHDVPSTPARELQLEHLVNAYFRLRPLFFTSASRCLFDSLALSNYLAKFRFFPNWIFGVRTDPFYAHCWLQFDDVVLNDTVEHARQFSPIMIVQDMEPM